MNTDYLWYMNDKESKRERLICNIYNFVVWITMNTFVVTENFKVNRMAKIQTKEICKN